MPSATGAPRDNISVEHGTVPSGDGTSTQHTTVITDRTAGRAWSGAGDTLNEASTKATRSFLGDRRAREYPG